MLFCFFWLFLPGSLLIFLKGLQHIISQNFANLWDLSWFFVTLKKRWGLRKTYGHNCTFCSVSLQEDSPRYNSLVRNAGVFCPMSRNDSPPLHSWFMQHMKAYQFGVDAICNVRSLRLAAILKWNARLVFNVWNGLKSLHNRAVSWSIGTACGHQPPRCICRVSPRMLVAIGRW